MYSWRRSLVWLLVALGAMAVPVRAFAQSSDQLGQSADQYAVAAAHYAAQRYKLAVQEFEIYLGRFPGRPMAVQAQFYAAEALIQLQRLDEAEKKFAALIKSTPEHAVANHALYRLGEIAYLRKRDPVARQHFQKFRQRYPKDDLNAYVLPYLGQLWLRADDPRQAQQMFLASIKTFPSGPFFDQSRLGLAKSFELQGDFDEARRFYQVLADGASGMSDEAALRLGLTYSKQRNWTAAVKSLRGFCDGRDKSPLLSEARYWLARCFREQDQHRQAADLLTRNASQFPKSKWAAESLFLASRSLRALKDNQAADERLAELVEQQSTSEWADDALFQLVKSAWDQKKYALTSARARQFEAMFATSAFLMRARELHGRSLLAERKFGPAVEVFEGLLTKLDAKAGKSPERVGKEVTPPDRYRYYLGVALLSTGKSERALENFGRIPPVADKVLTLSLHSARAAALIDLKRFEESLTPLQAYLATDANGPDAGKCRLQLAVSLIEVRRWDEAAEAFDAVRDKDQERPNYLPTTLYLAEKFFSGGQKAHAKRLFSELAKEGNPKEYAERGLSGLAWSEHALSRGVDSAEAFQRLIDRFPDSKLAAEAALVRGRWLEEQKKSAAALALYSFVVDKHARSPQAPHALLQAAQIHDREQRDKESAELLRRLLKGYPKYPKRDAVLYTLAWVLDESGDADGADKVFQRLHEQHSKSSFWPDATYRLAERAARREDFTQAAGFVRQIIAETPDSDVAPHAFYLQGQIAASQQKWDEVLVAMKKLIDGDNPAELTFPARYWHAEGLYRQRKYRLAEQEFAALQEVTSQRKDPWVGMIPLRRGQSLAHQKRWKEAWEIASTIPAKHPQLAQMYEVDYLLGRCLNARGKLSDAREAFGRVVGSRTGRKTETAAMAQWMIGETFFLQRNYPDAIRAYHRVVSLYSSELWQSASLLQAGKCHEAQGQWEKAADLYNQLLKDFGTTRYATQARQRLKVVEQKTAVLRERLGRRPR